MLPISYGDAQPLLAALKGPVAPAAWRGALPITYHVGPGPREGPLKLAFNWDLKPLYNVIARIPGTAYPDEWIIRGNHHDAWVNGAEDPVSGAVAVLEEARGLATLLQAGLEAEAHHRLLRLGRRGAGAARLDRVGRGARRGAAAQRGRVHQYRCATAAGICNVDGSHTLEKFINGVAGTSRIRRRRFRCGSGCSCRGSQSIADAGRAASRIAQARADLRIGALGSGSDYTAFLDHLGVASLNLGYGGEDGGGIYHSIYDDFYWYTHFADTDFVYGRALAQTAGTAVMRLAGAELLPFDFDDFTDTIRRYIEEVQKLCRRPSATRSCERNRQIDEGRVRGDRRSAREDCLLPPEGGGAAVPELRAAAERAGGARSAARRTIDQRWRSAGERRGGLARAALRDANDELMAVERALTSSRTDCRAGPGSSTRSTPRDSTRATA